MTDKRAGRAPAYERRGIVEHYDRQTELQPAERALFERHVAQGARVLDLGVGAGRTTPWLSARASSYVGADLSEAMVERCREKFPGLSFAQADATSLEAFATSCFDVVVFSFNGLDCIPTHEGRARCYAACARVLRPGGLLLFSSHNARYLVFAPVLQGGPLRAGWRLVYALAHTLSNLLFLLPTRAFWRGWGFVRDPSTHGGRKFMATREHVGAELARHGFELLETHAGGGVPRRLGLATPWYYYAARQTKAAG